MRTLNSVSISFELRPFGADRDTTFDNHPKSPAHETRQSDETASKRVDPTASTSRDGRLRFRCRAVAKTPYPSDRTGQDDRLGIFHLWVTDSLSRASPRPTVKSLSARTGLDLPCLTSPAGLGSRLECTPSLVSR